MIRAAIVGLGRWGRTLVAAIQDKSSEFRFTAGHSRTRATAEPFCTGHGIAWYDDLDRILTDPAIDAVVFATPHSQHGAQVECAAAAGKHVMMEKPFTLDVASAEKALAAVARAGVTLAVAYPRRFHPAMIELKTRLGDGRLGRPTHCESAQASPAGHFMPEGYYWRADPAEAPAGAMTATGVHNLDALIHLFGRIDEVYCRSRRHLVPTLEDTTSVLIGMENGVSASLYCSLVTAPTYRFAVYGTKGAVELAGRDAEFRFTAVPAAMPAGRHRAPAPEIIEYKGFNPLAAELAGFAAAIEGRRPYPITADEILHGVAAFEAIVRSAETGRPVKVARH
ncbi:MAG TPA: Gfo/Idh/MocA family oxidoreductase [Stellaceae bacterium]|nr:Gfo/Idh/MocA family oxidoreductase [Stellaceae bacterium]